jgi:ribosomal protein S6
MDGEDETVFGKSREIQKMEIRSLALEVKRDVKGNYFSRGPGGN